MKNRLYLLLPIRSLMFVGVFILLSLMSGEQLENLSHWWSVIASVINTLVIGILLFLCKKQKITYGKLVQYEKGKCKWYVALLIVISMLIVGMGGMYLAGYICYGAFPFLSFLPLTLWICCWYYKNRKPLPIMIGHGILNVATAVNILVTSAVPGIYEMMM